MFEAISAYLLEVSTISDDVLYSKFVSFLFVCTVKAPTYHVALEAVLVTCILYLIFSKSYRPESKHDKLTKEVSYGYSTGHYLLLKPTHERGDTPEDYLSMNVLVKFCCSCSICLHCYSHCHMSMQEEDQLIAEWEPEPLVPTEHPNDREVDPAPIVTG